jgi:hypothetical protein
VVGAVHVHHQLALVVVVVHVPDGGAIRPLRLHKEDLMGTWGTREEKP